MNGLRAVAFAGVAAFLLSGTAAMAGPQGLVDNFNDGDLAGWTATRILDANGGVHNTYAWDASSLSLQINTTVFDGIEQTALTRTDYSLGVGEELKALYDYTNLGSQDIGLYVGAGTPTEDVRADYVNIYVRDNGQLFSRGFDGASELGLSGGGSPNVDALFVKRTGASTFDLGWYDAGVRTVLVTRVLTTAAPVGDAIGFYSDVRAAGSRGNMDNIRITPEPASLALLGLGGLMVLTRRR